MKKQKNKIPEVPKTIDPALLTFDNRRVLVSTRLKEVTPSGVFEMIGVLEALLTELREHAAKLVRASIQ